jgi:hypothetical protein
MYDVLIQRMMRIEKALAQAETRANRLQQEIDLLYVERDNSFRTHEAQYNRMVAVIDRLSALEHKAFPNMGLMLDHLESVVGGFDKWHTNNPLDRRLKKS